MPISEIRPGDMVEEVFIVDAVEVKEGATGPYLVLTLRDRTGQVRGILWDGVQEAYDALKGRDFARIRGVATEYRGALNVRVSAIEPLDADEVDLEGLLEVVPEGVEEWHGRLIEAISNIEDRHCRDLVDSFIYDEKFMESFLKAPAGVSIHHDYRGGLLQHTTGVMTLATFASILHPGVLNRDVLITASFLHDIGKCAELDGGVRRQYTREGRFLGHITLALSMIEERLLRLPLFPAALAVSLKHMVVSHHGELEFGSPVKPATPEALVLHYLDGLDARLNHMLRVIQKAGDNSDKRPYSRVLGTDVQRENYVAQAEPGARRVPYELPWEYDHMAMYLQEARLMEQVRHSKIKRFLICPSCKAENSLYKIMRDPDSVIFDMKTKCAACQRWGFPLRMNYFGPGNGGNQEDAG